MSQTICKYFKHGACTRGSSCLFSHIPSAAKPVPTVVCPHFLLGKCRYGDKCINDHIRGPPAHHAEHCQDSPSKKDAAVVAEADTEVTLPRIKAADGSDKSGASLPLPLEINPGEENPDLLPKDQHASESSSSEPLVSASDPTNNEHNDKGFTGVTSEETPAANTPSPLPSPIHHPVMLSSSDSHGPAARPPSEQRQKLPCSVFALRGSCTDRDCPLPHSLSDHQYHLLITNVVSPQSICNFFATKGSCPLSSCLLRHLLLPEEYNILLSSMDQGSLESDPIPVAPRPAAPPCNFYSDGKCRNGYQYPYRHEDPLRDYEHITGHTPRNNVCKYYLSKEGCRRGNSCKFPHEGTSAPVAGGWGIRNEYSPQNDQADNPGDLGYTSSSDTRSSKPCRYGQECGYGDKCLFSHPPESEKAPEVPQAGVDDAWDAKSWGETNDAKRRSPSPEETATVNEDKTEWEGTGGGSWDNPGGASWDNPGGASWDETADAVGEDDHQEQPEETPSADGDQEGDQDSPFAGFDEHDDQGVSFFNCTVKYGPGAIPNSVITPFSTSTLLLSKLPPDVYDDEITKIVQPYGTPVEIVLEPEGATARIKFEDCLAASLAAQSLDGTEYQSVTLAATVDEAGVRLGESTRASRTVRLTWTTPNCTAWFFYDSITEAKGEVDRLNKLTFQGRKFEAEFGRPKKYQKNSFAVLLHGLPSDADPDMLKHSLEVRPELSTQIGPPSFTGDPVQRLQEELRCFGEVDNVEIAYVGPDTKTTAFVHFVTACAAANAVGALNGKEPTSLDGLGRIGAKHTFHICHNIDRCIFTPIEASIETIRTRYKTCQIIAVDRDDRVSLRLFGPDQEEYIQARKCLDVLVSGEPLLVGGKPLWDPYFDLVSCQKQLARLNKKHDVHIGLDFLNRIVRVHGPRERRVEAKKSLFDLLRLVHSQQFSVPIPQYSLRGLLNGGLEQLHDAIGPTKVDMDLIDRSVLVRGSEENKHKAEEMLLAFISSPEGDDHSRCSLCCVLPVDQVALPCGHLYCRSCLHTLILSAIGPKFSGLKCVAEVHIDDEDDVSSVSRCSAFIPYQIFIQILSKEDKDNLLESSFLAHIQQHTDELFYCPTAYCTSIFPAQNPIPGATLQCPTCSTWICPSCRAAFHESLDCELYKAVWMDSEFKEQE